MTKLLGICGSLRKESYNLKLLNEAARIYDPEEFVLADIDFPLYNGDVEDANGAPEKVKTLHAQIQEADGILIASPEYNKNIPGGLKNALDWVSRLSPFSWKKTPIAIMSASDGRAGGDRGQFSLRHCLTPFGGLVLQQPEVLLAFAQNEFDEDGRLKTESYTKALTRLMNSLREEIERR